MVIQFYTKFYTLSGKRVKIKGFWALILTFVEVTGEKLVAGWRGDELFAPSIKLKSGSQKDTSVGFVYALCRFSLKHP